LCVKRRWNFLSFFMGIRPPRGKTCLLWLYLTKRRLSRRQDVSLPRHPQRRARAHVQLRIADEVQALYETVTDEKNTLATAQAVASVLVGNELSQT
jgi:hypothetical protein